MLVKKNKGENMTLNNSRKVKRIYISVITIFMLCGLSYAKPAKVDSKLLTGTWFWNFGYDQEKFANEQLTLNKDKKHKQTLKKYQKYFKIFTYDGFAM